MNHSRMSSLRQGVRDGVPIALGYLAVAFALGIYAQKVGLTPGQSFLASVLCNASAGEYAGFQVIEARSSLIMMALMTFVANARYLLMSCALSQRADPKGKLIHRFLTPFAITDEIFAITVARPGYLDPYYMYGAILIASPCWGLGTALGCLAGDLMPARAVSALSVALFGMFLAVIIPPARKNKVILGLVLVCFAASTGFMYLTSLLPPQIADWLPEGTRTIILTVVIASAAALLFPRTQEDDPPQEGGDGQ